MSTEISSAASVSINYDEYNNMYNNLSKDDIIAELRQEIERMNKQVKFSKMALKQEKNKSLKENEKLLLEIDNLQRVNMFHSKESSRLQDECHCKDDSISQLRMK